MVGLSPVEAQVSTSLSEYISLSVSVIFTDMFWYVLMYACLFSDTDGLLPDNNKHYCPVDWEVFGALSTPSL